MMAGPGWEQVKELFQAALDVEPHRRAAFVREACGEDFQLRAEVESLLTAHERAGTFAQSLPIASVAAVRVLRLGESLGAYQITELLGAGGMGEVYRARDNRLNRDVALKVLPEAFLHDAERLARFKREAQVLASLNHPHIAQIYGLEETDGINALVMELVEGVDLAERIAEGPIPLDEALSIAKQIAEAMDAAHERAIIHRDLKPANIRLRPDGTVKVLDFGLAKAVDSNSLAAAAPLGNVQTITNPAVVSASGVILGTAAYMSPEQARGKPADNRSDIWAFGCVVFEMLAGRPVFDGEGIADVLVHVLEREPPWAALPANTPQPLRTLLKRCLEKERRKRIAAISTVLFVFEDAVDLAPTREPQDRGSAPSHAPRIAAAALLLGAVTAAAAGVWMATRPTSSPVTRLVISTSGATALAVDGNDRDLAITPDGARVVYRSANQLLVRALDQLQPMVLSATGTPRSVFVSPDGQWVGFVDGAGESPLKKVAITGGPAVTLTTTDAASRGASWGEDGSIVYATNNEDTGLQRVSSAGGVVTMLTKPDRGRGEADHLWPEFLPDGQAVLFTITALTGGLDNAQVAILDLGTGASTAVLRGGHHARYVSTGHLVYGAGGTLRAVPFDLRRRQVTGPSVPILDRVMTTGNGGVDVSVASTGTLVYVPGRTGIGPQRSLVWVDRTGREEPLPLEPRAYEYARISPDGARVALDIRDQEQDIWIWDIARQALARLTFTSTREVYPAWTPDSRRVLFSSDRAASVDIYSQAADGSGAAERVAGTTDQLPYSMSPDGTMLVVRKPGAQSGVDLLLLPLAPGAAVSSAGPAQPLIQTRFAELNAELAPDGRWIAYQSNESGRDEVYVRPFPDVAGGRWQVSTGGGRTPLWSRNGRELFYRSADKAVMAVRIEPGSAWRSSPPTQALPGRYFDNTGTTARSFDIAPDGQRFLMIKEGGGDEPASPQMVVVQKWFDELKARVQ